MVREAGGVHLLVVGIHQGHQASVALDHQALRYVRHIVELGLDFLGVDILAVGREYHGLVAAAYIYGASVGASHAAHVAGVEPAVGVEGGLGGLGIFVVSLHDILAAHDYLALAGRGIVGHDARLHHRQGAPGRARLKLAPGSVADERATLGHAVAHREGKLDAVQKLLHLGVERRAADNHLLKLAAEGLHQPGAYVARSSPGSASIQRTGLRVIIGTIILR